VRNELHAGGRLADVGLKTERHLEIAGGRREAPSDLDPREARAAAARANAGLEQ